MDTSAFKTFPYQLQEPDKTYKLPEELEEISGIAFYKDEETIACHNDEKGKIYLYDLEKEKIKDDFKFEKGGDYEDIAVIEEIAYVVRSDGKIFKIENFSSKDEKVHEYKTDLSSKNDVEGLCFDTTKKKLLLACKSSPNIKDTDHKGSRAIYTFDLIEKELEKEPYLIIPLDKIKDTVKSSAYEEFSKKMVKKLSDAGDPSFQPSGIDVHPITGDIYIISSVGKKIVVLSKTKKIIAIAPLDKKIFAQPEGICFRQNGDLLISNEGKKGKATILEFKYQ